MAVVQTTTDAMNRVRKLLVSALVVGVLGTVAALGVVGVFSATTQNAGNEISAGTVALTDNDGGSAMFSIVGASPGDSWTHCLKISYSGSLPADVHTYLKDASGPLADYLNLRIIQGTQASPTFPACTGFTPDATGTVFEGPLASPVPGSFAFGLPVVPAGQTAWELGSSLVFQFELTLDAATPDTLQASSTGTVTAVWEAHDR